MLYPPGHHLMECGIYDKSDTQEAESITARICHGNSQGGICVGFRNEVGREVITRQSSMLVNPNYYKFILFWIRTASG